MKKKIFLFTLLLFIMNICNDHGMTAPDTFAGILNKWIQAVRKQQNDKSYQLARKLLQIEPDNIMSPYCCGVSLFNLDKIDQSEKYIKKALRIDENHFWSNLMLFYIYFRQDKMVALKQALVVKKKITPKLINEHKDLKYFFSTYYFLLYNRNRIKLANIILKKAIKLYPKFTLLQAQYAWSFFRVDMKKWKKISRETMKLVPKNKLIGRGSYQFPLKGNQIYCSQGNNDAISHLGLFNGFGWDFVVVDKKKRLAKNFAKNESHYIFKQPVYAAQDGKVIYAYDSSPDGSPLSRTKYIANAVRIIHKYNEMSQYIHLNQGSIKVKVGDNVKQGQLIAAVGNSGKFADMPHLHFQVSIDWLCIESRLNGLEIWKNDKWVKVHNYIPKMDDLIRSNW